MKKNLIKIITLHCAIVTSINGFAQLNEYFTENTRRIDTYLNGPAKANMCDGVISFPAKYRSSKIKSDVFIASFLTDVFDSKIEEKDIDSYLKEFGPKKAVMKESLAGLIKVKEILLKGNYFKSNIILEFIDNTIIRGKARLTTITYAKCGTYENMIDFKLVKDFFIKDAKLLLTVAYDELTSDTIYSTNLSLISEKRKDYRFNIPGTGSENWINDIFIKQYQTDSTGSYNYSKAPKDFVRLIKENKATTIIDLLYSPNYFTSINAMEALIYLSSLNKVQLTPELNDRIVQIKSSTTKFLSQGAPDVFYPREGYKDLQMTDDRVIKKYSSSM